MHQRNLPHIYPKGASFFITFRLKNSIPFEILAQLQEERNLIIEQTKQLNLNELEKREVIYNEEKRFFGKYDTILDKFSKNENYLKNPEIAQIIANKFHEYDKNLYDLIAFCIMPNHVHVLFNTDGYDKVDISKIMRLIKGGSAYLCNKLLKREGEFWQKESYDHYVRNEEEYKNIIHYIVENPMKAGLVNDWQQWEFTYWKEE
jgi:REP element-mobilizing transposase RayT